ncbi:hypothetical protein CVT24_003839, partial [Panaeolus cyanescens]
FTVAKIFILHCGVKKHSSKSHSKSRQKLPSQSKYSLITRHNLPNLDYLESFGLGVIDQEKGFTFHKHWSVEDVDGYLRSLFPDPMAWMDQNNGWLALWKIPNSNALEVFPGVHPISGKEIYQIATANGIFNPNSRQTPVLAFASKKAIPQSIINGWISPSRTPSFSTKPSHQSRSKTSDIDSEPDGSDTGSESDGDSVSSVGSHSSGSASDDEDTSPSNSEDVQVEIHNEDAVDDWAMEDSGNRSPTQMTEMVQSRPVSPLGDLNASFDQSMLVSKDDKFFNFTDESDSEDDIFDDCEFGVPRLVPVEL